LIINKRRRPLTILLLVLTSFLFAHGLFLILPNLFRAWDAKATDRLFHYRASSDAFRPVYDDTVVHVDLSDHTLQKLDDFYLNRSHHARVIRNLAAMEVEAILYDFIFAARTSEKDDRQLIQAATRAGDVFFGLAFKLSREPGAAVEDRGYSKSYACLDRSKWRVRVEGDLSDFYAGSEPLSTFPELAATAKGLGYLSLKFDHDGVFRRLPLLVRYRDALYPSFALAAACAYYGVPPERVVVRPGRELVLENARRPKASKPCNIAIPIDDSGNMIVNFIGGWERMKHYDFADVLRASDDRHEMDMWRDELGGKIAVVSEVLTGAADLGPVPTDANFSLSGVHANAIHTILTRDFLRELKGWETFLVEFVLLAFLFVLALEVPSPYFSLSAISVGAVYVGVAVSGFLFSNMIFQTVRPLLMVTLATLAVVVYRYIEEEKEHRFIQDTFGRYISQEVVDELLGSPEGLKISGELREVTFLVSDLRGFTILSRRLSPRVIIEIINRYLERMLDVIASYRGTVNEIQGDGILVFFGAPLSLSDDAERAVACAIEMQNAMAAFNEEQRRLLLPEMKMGIGVNTGEVVVGNIGSERRAKYSAIGSPINTAFRIESYTVGGQILISPSTYEKVHSLVRLNGAIDVEFKGIDQPVTVYDVIGLEGTYRLSRIPEERESWVTLDPPFPIRCFSVEETHMSEEAVTGALIRMSGVSAEVSLDRSVRVRCNLKVVVSVPGRQELPELYAKVLSVCRAGDSEAGFAAVLAFTGLPEDIREVLKSSRKD